jgi:hypothetical protein
MQAFFYFPFLTFPPSSAIRFRNSGLQEGAMPEAIVPYTVSGLENLEILARTVLLFSEDCDFGAVLILQHGVSDEPSTYQA